MRFALTEPDLVRGRSAPTMRWPMFRSTTSKPTIVGPLSWLKEHKVDVVLVGLQYVDQMALDDNYRAVRDLLRKLAAKENIMIVRRYEAQQFLARAESGGGLVPDEFQRTGAVMCALPNTWRGHYAGHLPAQAEVYGAGPAAAEPQR